MTDKPQVIAPLEIEVVRHLSLDQWNACVDETKKKIKSDNPAPDLDQYLNTGIDELPPALSNTLIGLLILVAVGALIVSAGKQLIVANLAFSDLLKVTDTLSPLWLITAMIVSLMVGELGCLLFALGASIFPSGRHILRVFSIGSASIALIANITVTALHPVEGVVWFQWVTTLFFPLVILGIGYMCEIILVKRVDKRRTAIQRYNEAFAAWQPIDAAPEANKKYKKELYHIVVAALRSVQATQKLRAWDVAITNPIFCRDVFLAEYVRYAVEPDFELDGSRPTPLSDTSPVSERNEISDKQPLSSPALPAKLGFSSMNLESTPSA